MSVTEIAMTLREIIVVLGNLERLLEKMNLPSKYQSCKMQNSHGGIGIEDGF